VRQGRKATGLLKEKKEEIIIVSNDFLNKSIKLGPFFSPWISNTT
jgi:hypothetical protein